MKVLILTGRFGMGHYSAAEAVKQEILTVSPDAEINLVDIIDDMFPCLSKKIYKGFNFLVSKCSCVYNFLNSITAKYSDVPLKKSFINKTENLLAKYQADLVISTLPASSQYISAYKMLKRCNIPLYTYITDITAHEEWIAEKTDMYFVGSFSTKNTLISKGVSEQKIVVCGIPVKQNFKNSNHSEDRKEKKEILIMGGGLGIIPSYDVLLNALCEIQSIHITLIAGKNKKLYNKIKNAFPQITVIGYTDQVYEYMRAADLIITKSGGITVFEAIYTQTPLYIVKPFLVQEIGNAEFVQNLNIGRVIWSKNINITEDVISLLSNQQLLDTMKNNMKNVKDEMEPCSPLFIYNQKGTTICQLNI